MQRTAVPASKLARPSAGDPQHVRLKIYMINPLDTKTFTDISSEEFELFVRNILKTPSNQVKNFKAVHRDKIEGVDGTYEIDVSARFSALGVDFNLGRVQTPQESNKAGSSPNSS